MRISWTDYIKKMEILKRLGTTKKLLLTETGGILRTCNEERMLGEFNIHMTLSSRQVVKILLEKF